MKKTICSSFALLLSALLLLPILASCSIVQEFTHTYQYESDGVNHWRVCTECREKTAEEPHTLRLKESVAATCDHEGYEVYECSVCGYAKTDFSPKRAHDFQPVEGSDACECSLCHRKETALVELPEEERYGYRYLASLPRAEVYLRAYGKLATAVAARSAKASLYEDLTRDELTTIYSCVSADHPEYFWVGTRYEYTYSEKEIRDVTLPYLLSEGDMAPAKEVFNAAADKILSGISASMTDLEKELYIHDVIVKNNVYDETQKAPMTHSAYGALVLGTSVCDGYTKLFHYLMARCGVLTVAVSGYSGENHSWNAVLLDGDWYMVDLTWDDPIGQEPGVASHTYFNLSWDRFSLDHSFTTPKGEFIDNYYDIPSCTSDKYDYFKYFGYEGELNIESIERVMRLQAEKGETSHFQIRITGLSGTADEKVKAITSYMRSETGLYSTVARILGKRASAIQISYGTSADGSILKITVE